MLCIEYLYWVVHPRVLIKFSVFARRQDLAHSPLVRPCVCGWVRYTFDVLLQGSTPAANSEAVTEARRIRRQRKLDQAEIPQEHLFITTDLLGKGGFGEVYLADYNGHNAAAKVRDNGILFKR